MPTSIMTPDRPAKSGDDRLLGPRFHQEPMLWLKAFHIIFMVTWFAGLFYLPRLFVYHCAINDAAGQARFCTMERKLFAIMTIGAVGTVFFGVTQITGIFAIPGQPDLLDAPWLRMKVL